MLRLCATALSVLCGAAVAGFPAPAAAGSYTVLHSFQGGPDGAGPSGDLAVARGRIFGTTYTGGATSNGTVFALNPKTGIGGVAYSFQGQHDGSGPLAGVIAAGADLYGATSNGGASGNGSVFSLDPKTGAEKVIYSFRGGASGAHPQAGLLKIGGVLYGTTTNGGAQNDGTVFQLTLKTGRLKILHSFAGGSDGAYPFAGLVYAGGTLYGTTSGGGVASCQPYGCGTVYSIDPASGTEKQIYAFQGGNDGAVPYAGLIDVGGMLVGTTTNGGGGPCGRGCGTVYSLNPATGAEQILYAFQGGNDGAIPLDSVIDVSGLLYGTTQEGGANDKGVVFALNPVMGTISTLHAFAGGSDGEAPYGGLIDVSGVLYGTTQSGGNAHDGTVFSMTP